MALVSRVQGTYEFEVQPLRDYLLRGSSTRPLLTPDWKRERGTKPDRFAAISRSFYWLNVTRFTRAATARESCHRWLTVCASWRLQKVKEPRPPEVVNWDPARRLGILSAPTLGARESRADCES